MGMGMETANLNIRVDKQVKADAEKLFAEMGLTMTAAIGLFLRQAIRENGLPFRATLEPLCNRTTLDAIEEARRLARDPNAETYSSLEDWKASLDL